MDLLDSGRRLLGAPSGRDSTVAEDTVMLVLSAWLIGGLFLDGYAHAYVIDTATEDFLTPWHGVFYAAFGRLPAGRRRSRHLRRRRDRRRGVAHRLRG